MLYYIQYIIDLNNILYIIVAKVNFQEYDTLSIHVKKKGHHR